MFHGMHAWRCSIAKRLRFQELLADDGVIQLRIIGGSMHIVWEAAERSMAVAVAVIS